LAVVLDGSPRFAQRMLTAAKLWPEGADSAVEFKVSTQHRTRRGKYVDLQLLALGDNGHPVARLWSEHKTGSPYSQGQLTGCATELARIPDAGRLVTIVDARDFPRAPLGPWDSWACRNVASWADSCAGSMRLRRSPDTSATSPRRSRLRTSPTSMRGRLASRVRSQRNRQGR
jgi:hypothetical protein